MSERRLRIEELVAVGEDLSREFDRLQLDYAMFGGGASVLARQDAVLDAMRENSRRLRVLVSGSREDVPPVS